MIQEMDIEGKRIMMRVNLKLSEEPDCLEKKQLHEQRIF